MAQFNSAFCVGLAPQELLIDSFVYHARSDDIQKQENHLFLPALHVGRNRGADFVSAAIMSQEDR